jgi:hypothetical protein
MGDDAVVGADARAGGEHDPADHGRVGWLAVVVGVGVDHDQAVGELAGDIGQVAPAALGGEIHAMAAGVAGQALDEGVGVGIDDRDRPGQGVGRHDVLAGGAHRRLDGKRPDRPGDRAANGVVVGEQVDRLGHPWRLAHVHDADGAVEIVGDVVLAETDLHQSCRNCHNATKR